MAERTARTKIQNAGLVLGLAALVVTLISEAPAGLPPAAWTVAGVLALMALWWSTEALPLAVTALMPLAVLPLLDAVKAETLAGGYGNTTLFLILGGFLLALAMERSELHRRIAYNIVVHAGGHPQGLVLGMMCATGFVSMWVSNTSTSLMMLPVAMSIAAIVAPDPAVDDRNAHNFSAAIVLCVAYSATIGGLGTLIGTPTNALVVGFMKQNYGITVSFAQWLTFGLPVVLLLMPIAWLVLVRVVFPFKLGSQVTAGAALRSALVALGPMSRAERRVTAILLLTAGAWILSPLLKLLPGLVGLNDTTIALVAGISLFLVPNGGEQGGALLDGMDLKRVPWPVLLLFGGGLALAAAIQDSGLSEFIGEALTGLATLPLIALIAAIVTLIVFWTEVNSNVATAATFMPILAAIAAGTHYPVLQLVAPAVMASSCGFMLPAGTPPNAIVFGTGRLKMSEMLRAGWRINIAAIVIVTIVTYIAL
jgi:sodium-dependent dicarboxylate transporter 2/3/5